MTEFNCVCGDPSSVGVVHRTDGPCFHVTPYALIQGPVTVDPNCTFSVGIAPSAPAEPMVSISLSDAKVLQQYLATSIFIDNEESAFFRFESAIASTQSTEGK